jgi:hypothetical protein
MPIFFKKTFIWWIIVLIITAPALTATKTVLAEETRDLNEGISIKMNKITVSSDVAYALDTKGRLWSWGGGFSNYRGFDPMPGTLDFFDGKTIKDIQSGLFNLIVLLEDGTVWSHDNKKNNTNAFQQLSDLHEIESISVGYNYSYAIATDGTVWKFSQTEPVQLSKLEGVSGSDLNQIYDNYIVKKDGTVWDITRVSYPQQIMGLTNIKKIFEGNFGLTTYALTNEGAVWGWGSKHMGEIDLEYLSEDDEKAKVPVLIEGLDHVADITGGSQHFTVAKEDGSVWAWGLNPLNQLGDGTKNNSAKPVRVGNLNNVKLVFGNRTSDENFALLTDGTVQVWGGNKGCVTGVACTQSSISSPTLVRFPPPAEKADNHFSIQAIGAKGNQFIDEASDDQGNIVVVGESKLFVSNDYGQKWVEEERPVSSSYVNIKYVHDRFYLWTYNSTSEFYWSVDGHAWTRGELEAQVGNTLTIQNIMWVHDQYVLFLDTSFKDITYVFTCSNGVEWSKIGTIPESMNQLIWNGKRYSAFGGGYEYVGTPQTRNQFQANPTDKSEFSEMIVYTSDDLAAWTHQSGAVREPMKQGWNSVPYKGYGYRFQEMDKNGALVFLDSYNNILTSQDGINFKLKKNLDVFYKADMYSPLFWNGKQYILYTRSVRKEPKTYVSNDKNNWNEQKLTNIAGPIDVLQSGKTFIAFNEWGLIAVSKDGLKWDIKKRAFPALSTNKILNINGSYISVGSAFSVPAIMTSKDGNNWTQTLKTDPMDYDSREISSIDWNGKGFVAVGGKVSWTSKDGIAWKKNTLKLETYHLKKMIWSGKQYVALGDLFDKNGKQYKTILYTSSDGLSWTKGLDYSGILTDIASHEGTVIAVGSNKKQAVALQSTNLKDWKTQSFTLGNEDKQWAYKNDTFEDYSHTFLNVQWAKDHFVIMSDHIYTSNDGVKWCAIKNDYSEYVKGRTAQGSIANGRVIWTGKDYRYFRNNNLGVSTDLKNWHFYNIPQLVNGLQDMIWTGTDLLAVGDGLIVRITDR